MLLEYRMSAVGSRRGSNAIAEKTRYVLDMQMHDAHLLWQNKQ